MKGLIEDGISPIDIISELKDALLINPGREIKEMDIHRMREHDFLLAAFIDRSQ